MIAAFNPVGNPVFQRLTELKEMQEGNYTALWKTYFFSLVSNWVLDLYEGVFTSEMKELEDLLDRTGLNSADDAPETVFSQLMNRLRDLTPKSAQLDVVLGPQGIPLLLPRVEFEQKPTPETEAVRHDDALGKVNEILRSEKIVVWVVMDRLDEAFQGFPAIELPALRALLRTYLDMQAFSQIRLKLFIRNDLFRRVASGWLCQSHARECEED